MVVEAQKQLAANFQEAWVVYDKDGHSKHKEAVQSAATPINGQVVNIAFSSISFEHWVLLHFERSLEPFPKSANVIERLIQKGYCPKYAKSNQYNCYFELAPYLQTALENAAWLRFQKRQELKQKKHVYLLNPYTDIDHLVRRLLQIEEQFIFASLGEEITIDTLVFCCQLDESRLKIAVINEGKKSILSNKITITTVPKKEIGAFSSSMILPNSPPETIEIDNQDLEEISIYYHKTKLTYLL